jgi:hypothetical protein
MPGCAQDVANLQTTLEWEVGRTGFEAALLLRPNILAYMGRKARNALPTKG